MATAKRSDEETAGLAAFAIAVMIPFVLREKGIFDSADIRKLLSGAAGYADSEEFAPDASAATRRRVGALLRGVLSRVPD
jgi:hypothetical protein